jgi:phage virion morphogenesis protein
MTAAASNLHIKWGTKEATRRLTGLSLLRHEVLLGKLGSEMLRQNRERLDVLKEGPDGQKWPAWSAKYAASSGGEGDLLEKSHKLLDSLAVEQGPDAVSVGSDLLYAIAHLQGSTNRNIPARPFLGFSDDNIAELQVIAQEFLEGEAR